MRELRQHLCQFAALTDDEWQAIEPYLREMTLPRKTLFVSEGTRAKLVGFVMKGSLRQFYTRDGEEKTTYFFFEQTLVAGYISCLTQQPSLVSIETLEDTSLCVFPFEIMERLCEEFSGWNHIARKIAEYAAIGLEMRLAEHLLYSPEERYAMLVESGRTRILERIPQQYIASYLGITPVSLSRIRNRLAATANKDKTAPEGFGVFLNNCKE